MPSAIPQSSEPKTLFGKGIRRFYEPVVLSEALSMACHSESTSYRSVPQPLERPSTPRERYHQYVYRLAYVSSFDKGPSTVCANTVVEAPDGAILYVFAGNSLEAGDGQRIKAHIQSLLRNVARAGSGSTTETRSTVFFQVLLFARPRIEAYLKSLASNATKLLDRYRDNRPASLADFTSLELLACCADVASDGKMVAKLEAKTYLYDCVKCIRSMRKITTDVQKLHKHASQGSSGRDSASEILHCLSRLLAYHQAVKSFFSAYKEWPELFVNPKALHLQSSSPLKKALGPSSHSAEAIIGRLTNNLEVMQMYRQFAEDMQKFNINDRIRNKCSKDAYRVIHAEILIHDWVTRSENADVYTFFNGWKYIGCSKPPCRLCKYYVDAADTGIAMRPSHNNIYLNWRLPDAQGSSLEEGKKWQDTLNKLTARIRDDAFQIIWEKTSPGKKHDSNTYDIRSFRSTMASVVSEKGGFDARMESLGNAFASRLTLRHSAYTQDEDEDQVGGVSLTSVRI